MSREDSTIPEQLQLLPIEAEVQTIPLDVIGWIKNKKRALACVAVMALAAGGIDYVYNKAQAQQAEIAHLINHDAALQQNEQILQSEDSGLTFSNQSLDNEIARSTRILDELDGNSYSPSLITGSGLTSPSSLPGYDDKVTAEERQLMKQSSLEFAYKQLGTTTWQETCSASKVSYDDQTYVLMARHCLTGLAGSPITSDYNSYPGLMAENIYPKLLDTLAILDPEIPTATRIDSSPIAIVTGVAIDDSGISDTALLRVSPLTSGFTGRSFDEIPSLNLNQSYEIPLGVPPQGKYSTPEVGQEVALQSNPEAGHFDATSATGIYLGEVLGAESGLSSITELVGINPENPQSDACNYGSSGSTAMLANGELLGPLSLRDNIGYAPSYYLQAGEKPKDSAETRLYFEQETGINMDRFSTICGFSPADQNETYPNLVSVLDDPSLVIESGK